MRLISLAFSVIPLSKTRNMRSTKCIPPIYISRMVCKTIYSNQQIMFESSMLECCYMTLNPAQLSRLLQINVLAVLVNKGSYILVNNAVLPDWTHLIINELGKYCHCTIRQFHMLCCIWYHLFPFFRCISYQPFPLFLMKINTFPIREVMGKGEEWVWQKVDSNSGWSCWMQLLWVLCCLHLVIRNLLFPTYDKLDVVKCFNIRKSTNVMLHFILS